MWTPISFRSLERKVRKSIDDISDKEYMDLVASIGCIACIADGNPGTPAELHHPRERVGAAERAPDRDVIPLCPEHHRIGSVVPSIHKHQQMFARFYGETYELVKITRYMAKGILNVTVGKRA